MSDAKRVTARALADLAEGTILAVVEIDAPAERVFAALTDPAEVVQWWGSDDTYRVTEWTADLRVGGAWKSGGVGVDGHAFTVEGEFLEIDPPRRLVQTWKAAWDPGHTTTIRYQLDSIPSGTRVTVRHDGFLGRPETCDSHTTGWERVLGWLAKHVTGKEPVGAAPDRYFFCRLLPPRPTFMQDITEAELAVMKAHAGYWTALSAQRIAIVFGPVADPNGGFGIGVVQVEDEAAMRTIEANDPAIIANIGLRYDIQPMVRAVARE